MSDKYRVEGLFQIVITTEADYKQAAIEGIYHLIKKAIVDAAKNSAYPTEVEMLVSDIDAVYVGGGK